MAVAGEQGAGWLWNFSTNQLDSPDDVCCDLEKWDRATGNTGELVTFRTSVFSLTLEGRHTYFVGEPGLLVSGLKLQEEP
jgi:hypothetical protein